MVKLNYDDQALCQRIRILAKAAKEGRLHAVRMILELFQRNGWKVDNFQNGDWRAELTDEEHTRREKITDLLGGGAFVNLVIYSEFTGAHAYWFGLARNKFHIETMLTTIPRENRLDLFFNCFTVPSRRVPVDRTVHSSPEDEPLAPSSGWREFSAMADPDGSWAGVYRVCPDL